MAKLPEQLGNKNKNKKRGLKILLVLMALLLGFVIGVFAFFYIKLERMRHNHVAVIPQPLDVPSETAAPPSLVPIDEQRYKDLTGAYDPNLSDYDDDLDPDGMTGLHGMNVGKDSINYVPRIDPDVTNILLFGSDARPHEQNGRSDTMMLLSYNKVTRKAKLVSFLRDSWVYIPGRNKWNRLNTAYYFGGIGLAVNTINYNFGLDVQQYMRVGFESLEQIVDLLGGLDLELSVEEIKFINAEASPQLPLTAGVHHLNGEQVLRHSRNRSVGNVDWARTARQRKIMYAFLERARQEKDISSLTELILSLTEHVQTNMTPLQLTSLGVDVVLGGDLELQDRAVPFEGTWSYAWEGRMAVIHLDAEANRKLLREYLYGK